MKKISTRVVEENKDMESNFSVEEKRKFMLKKHIKDHLFEYILI